jgi:hypothetical protein
MFQNEFIGLYKDKYVGEYHFTLLPFIFDKSFVL